MSRDKCQVTTVASGDAGRSQVLFERSSSALQGLCDPLVCLHPPLRNFSTINSQAVSKDPIGPSIVIKCENIYDNQ
jgi:hypothetical protein